MSDSAQIRRYLLSQFEDPIAQQELRSLGTQGFNWLDRTYATILRSAELLPEIGAELRDKLDREFNSGSLLKEEYAKGEKLVHAAKPGASELRNWYEATGKVVATVKETNTIDSKQVSAGVQAILVASETFGSTFVLNGSSTYPDLLWANASYEGLPIQSRTNLVDGPCMRGGKPSNVPDGIEIKTNRGNKIKVDAHGAHLGLHLGVTWDIIGRQFAVTGVWVAYIRFADHRESGRNVTVTTVKYSFGHNLFMSVL